MPTVTKKKIPYRLQALRADQIEAIHEATLEVLCETGAFLGDETAVRLLRSAGAIAETDGHVRIPPKLVETAISTAPRSMVLYTRGGDEAMRLEEGLVYCGTGSDCPNVLDFETGKRRPARKSDVEVFARLCDALPDIDFVLSMGLACDVPAKTADLHHFQAMVCNTTKPVVFTAVEPENLTCIIDLAAEIAGGAKALAKHPFLVHFAMASPPLRHSQIALQNLIHCARQSIPVVYASGTAMGASGPMAIAGGTVSSNCDVLAGLVVHQLANPGAPFIYGVGVSLMDMRTMIDSYGAPEHYLGDVVNAQVAHSYGLPTWGYAACTDSKVLDLQAALEFQASTLSGMLSGCNMLHDVGYLESGLTASCESIVFGNELIASARRMLQEVRVDQESLAVNLIKRIGFEGTFLADRHTVKHLRDFRYSKLIDRQRYDAWAADNHQTMYDRLRTRVEEILSSHQPAALAESMVFRMEDLISARDKSTLGN